MKSETHIRIKESRNKYFQEMRDRLAEKSESVHAAEPKIHNAQNAIKSTIAFKPSISISDLYNKEAVDRKVKVLQLYSGQVTSNLVAAKKSMTASVNQQSEKVKDRLTSLMLVLFDT